MDDVTSENSSKKSQVNNIDKGSSSMEKSGDESPQLDKLVRLGKKGEGVYGIVYSAYDKNDEGTTFAVKRNLIDVSGDFVGSIRELDILVRLNGHPHIVTVNSISFGDPFGGGIGNTLSPISDGDYKDDKIHFIFEEAREDGSSYFPEASWSDLKRCMVHLLLAVEYCHAKGVIHRDLKPANLLIFDSLDNKVPDVNDQPTLKICDFGLSKPGTYQGKQTPSVVTSWYRAPEIFLEEDYDDKVDLWSAGCIFYEMVTKLPLLHGSPDRADTILGNLNSLFPKLSLIKSQETGKIIPRRHRVTWKDQLHRKAPIEEMAEQGWDMVLFLNLLDHLLCSAEDRYSATEALDHKFFGDYLEYITITRKEYPPIPNSEPKIVFVKGKERDGACKIARKIFIDRHKYNWYSHRILFQAISIFDRFLAKNPGKLDIKNIRIAFTVCLYIAVKYFSTLSILIPFSSLYGEISDDEKRWAEEFEINLLEKISNYTIYHPTLYEAADTLGEILEDDHVFDLLNIYIDGKVKLRGTEQSFDINGLQPTQVYRYYRGKVAVDNI